MKDPLTKAPPSLDAALARRYNLTPLAAADRTIERGPTLDSSSDSTSASRRQQNGEPGAARLPTSQARLTKSTKNYANLTSKKQAVRSETLDLMDTNRDGVATAVALDKSHTTRKVSARSGLGDAFRKGVELKFESHPGRSVPQRVAHAGSSYLLSGGESLLVLAGAHDKPALFAELLFSNATEDDSLKEICHELQRGAFISASCLREVVHMAAAEGVEVQSANRDSRGTNAGSYIYRAHRVVAAYLVGLRSTQIESNAENAFQAIMVPVQERSYMNAVDQSTYAGIVTGICLGGVGRFLKDEIERKTRNQDRLKYAIAGLGVGVGVAPLVGSGVGGVISFLAEPIAKSVFKLGDGSGQVERIGAAIEDEMRSNPPANVQWAEFNLQLEKTLRHCGFPY